MLTAESINQKIRKEALIKGLLLGAVLLILSILSYYLIVSLTDTVWVILVIPFLLSIIIPIAISIFLCLDLRKNIGGYWNFKQAVTGVFIMFIMAYVIQTVGRDLIFAKLIVPDMVQNTEQAAISSTTKMMEKSGVDQATIDQKTEEVQKQFDEQKNMTPGKIIQGIAITVILIFVLSIVFAAVLKREPPLFVTELSDEVIE